MEKDKKYNVVLGLMIFFFLVIVGVSIAWGLGYIGIKSNDVASNNEIANGKTDNENSVNIDTKNNISNLN